MSLGMRSDQYTMFQYLLISNRKNSEWALMYVDLSFLAKRTPQGSITKVLSFTKEVK